MITQPMLAAKKPVLEKLAFPLLATPKIDGIRCIKIGGKALSRSFKPIPNHHIREMIEKNCPDGFDGEIICGNGFSDVQSLVMTREGTPDFVYLVFDYVTKSLETTYLERITNLATAFNANPTMMTFCSPLIPIMVESLDELQTIIDKHLLEGYEGTMIRTPGSPYKCGRSTLKEGYLTAIKQFVDAEAEVIGFEEQMHNDNKALEDAFGYTERSSHKEHMVPANTLGAFLVRDLESKVEFKIGTGKGLTADLKKEIWTNKNSFLGKVIHYRYQPHGVKDRPRIPSFYGFRHQEDMSK